MPVLRPILAIAALALMAPTCWGQITLVDWTTASDGLYTDPANWSDGAVPTGGLMGPRFALQGFYRVNLPTDSTLSVGAISSSPANPSQLFLRPADSAADASVVVSGELAHAGGTLILENSGLGIDTHVSALSTVVSDGGELWVTGGSTLTTQQLDVQMGSASKSSALKIRSSGASDLGQVTIGQAGVGQQEAVLLIENGAGVTAGDIAIASIGQSNHQGELFVDNSTLMQAAASTMTIGHHGDSITAQVFVASGGHLTTGATTMIHQSGEMRNIGSQVSFAGDLIVDGGAYTESKAAVRSFAPGTLIDARNGGQVAFAGADLMLDDSQTLRATDPATVIQVDENLLLGESTTLALGFGLTPPADAMIQVVGQAEIEAEISISIAPDASLAPGDAYPLVRAAGFLGSPTISDAPLLPSWQAWQLTTNAGLLWAEVVQHTAPGDFNHDGIVDAADYVVWRDSMGSQSLLAADANGDGVIDTGDYNLWREYFGHSFTLAAHSPTQSPEPSAFVVLLVTSCAIVVRRDLMSKA